MPKPLNKSFGRCQCRVSGCTELADVRRMKNHERGAQYLACPAHGIDRAQGTATQRLLDEWIEQHNQGQAAPEPGPEVSEPGPKTEPEPEKQEETPPGPEPEPERDEKGPGFFKRSAQDLEDWLNA